MIPKEKINDYVYGLLSRHEQEQVGKEIEQNPEWKEFAERLEMEKNFITQKINL